MKRLKEIAKWTIPVAILNFFVGYGAKSLVNDVANYQPETTCEERLEQPEGRLFTSPSTTYDRITNQVYRNRLEEIRVDHGGDGTIDDTIVFFTRRTGAILSENAIGIYDGFPLPDNQRERVRLPADITSDQYKESARRVLDERGYDAEALGNFTFF